MNSRRKGALGELEFSAFLRGRGIEARRGQQFAGGQDSHDVVHDYPRRPLRGETSFFLNDK